MRRANFAPITEEKEVFGACRPGHLGSDLHQWAHTLQEGGVTDVICLLSKSEAARWSLPRKYADLFGTYHLPIRDRHLPDQTSLAATIQEMEVRTANGGKVALHCNAGLGRTGIVGAAWLTSQYGYQPQDAVNRVIAAGRSPYQAVEADNATEQELFNLLDSL